MNRILEALEVKTSALSPQFVGWLANRIGGWVGLEEFKQYVPSSWTHVVRDGCDLCYLFGDEQIMAVSARARDSDLIVIGALMDGSLLALNAGTNAHIEIGKISLGASLSNGTFGLVDFAPLPMDYPSWLELLIRNPQDNTFL